MLNSTTFRALVGAKMFTVTFTKVNGDERTINGTLNMASSIKGTGQPITDGRIVMKTSKGPRSFYPERMLSLKANGLTYNWCGKVVR